MARLYPIVWLHDLTETGFCSKLTISRDAIIPAFIAVSIIVQNIIHLLRFHKNLILVHLLTLYPCLTYAMNVMSYLVWRLTNWLPNNSYHSSFDVTQNHGINLLLADRIIVFSDCLLIWVICSRWSLINQILPNLKFERKNNEVLW